MCTLEGRKAIVCGSTQGIGRACAIELARNGAEITLLARHAEALEKVRTELPSEQGQHHHALQADFGRWEDVRDVATRHVAEHGPIHILLNNTGGPTAGPAFEGQPDEYADAFAKHLLCNQVLVQAVAPGMRDAGYGRIINIISTSVTMPIKGLGVSNTIRGAVANWGRTIAAELAPFGITVNNLLPGFTGTTRLDALIKGKAQRAGCTVGEMQEQMKATVPARRFGTPQEIGAVAAFLASPAAAYVNGVNLPVDGGRLAAQ